MKLYLRRELTQPDCTLGLLLIPEASLTLCTMELPWVPSETCKGGTKGKSCVPVGRYQLMRHNTPNKPFTWALVNHDLDVVHQEGDDDDPDEDRATCLIHVANYARQLQGCIAPGIAHAMNGNEHMVTNSTTAMLKLREAVPWTDGHELIVTDTP